MQTQRDVLFKTSYEFSKPPERVLAPMELLVAPFFHSSSFLVAFYKDQEVISNHSELTIPSGVLLYLIVFASCFMHCQREQSSENSCHMPGRNMRPLA